MMISPSNKIELYMPSGVTKPESGAPGHRKKPSLYIKSNYMNSPSQLANPGAASRHSSIERGVTSFSRDQLNHSNVKLKLSTAAPSHYLNPSNIIETRVPGSQLDIATSKVDKERGDTPSNIKRGAKPIIRTTVIRSRKDSAVAVNISMNKSVEKLKHTFNLGQRPLDKENKEEYEKKAQSSTKCTTEPDLTIMWRDDLDVDVEKELTFTSCLGQGSFAKVYEGQDKKMNQTVAIKVIDKRKIADVKRRNLIQTEVNIIARMKHANIAEFYRLVEDHKRVFLVMQLCGSLTLNHFCRQFSDKKLNEEQGYAVFSQIVKGVKYMHDHNVAHRDLKLTNILIDDAYTVKVIDFGFACEANERHKMYCGTPSYMAPEIVEKKTYLPKPVDVWSLGVILFKLLTGEYAFGGSLANSLSRG